MAAGLSDSPAGLAAWIVEKFRAWSDCGGDLERGGHFTASEAPGALAEIVRALAAEVLGG